MTSPDDSDPVRSELEYAPPWVREQAAREQGPGEQGAREQAAREPAPREPAPREQMTRDQFRAALRQSGGAALEQRTHSNSESRSFSDDRPWHQRALEPELVPEPPSGASNHWPMMLRLGAVCTIAAMVAAAVVFLFSPKQIAHKIAQANASDDATPASIESSRDVPALSVETSAPTAPLAQGQVAIATRPQLPQTELAATSQPAEGTGCRRTAAKTGTARGPRSAGAAARIPSPAERIDRTGHQRAGAGAGREQSGATASAGPNRTGPSRTAERRQARNRARPK